MNQGRGPRDGTALDVRCSDWRYENTHLEIGAAGSSFEAEYEDYPGLTCLDFSHEAVRQERLELIAELLEHYGGGADGEGGMSGLELVFNYGAHAAVLLLLL